MKWWNNAKEKYYSIPVGTRSLLFGGHQFIIHPIAVAVSWRMIRKSWPKDWRIWVCIVCHDWGYWGCPNMDGMEGKLHPEKGARIAATIITKFSKRENDWDTESQYIFARWFNFSAYHSRHYARANGEYCSDLMGPDKLATVIVPPWLLWILFGLSQEWHEYVELRMKLPDCPFKTYPTRWEYVNHIQSEWQRFRKDGADIGTLFS